MAQNKITYVKILVKYCDLLNNPLSEICMIYMFRVYAKAYIKFYEEKTSLTVIFSPKTWKLAR